MPWNFTNQQLDPMILSIAAAPITVAGGATVAINQAPASIRYHNLNYALVGLWPFPDNQNVNANYAGQNISVTNPQTGVTAIYHYQAPPAN